jgi:hypothetical protein
MSDFGFSTLAIGILVLGYLVPGLIIAVATLITYTMAISQVITGILIFVG